MSLDQTSLQRLSQQLAVALNELVAPLREEIAHLRAELDRVRAGSAAAATAAPRPAEVAPRAAVRPAPAVPARRPAKAADHLGPCQVPKCEAVVLAKQLCETHYRIMRRLNAAGQKFDPKTQRPSSARTGTKGCSEGGCDEPHYAKGLCRRHYMATRARERNAPRRAAREAAVSRNAAARMETRESAPVKEAAEEPAPPVIVWETTDPHASMPTAEVVARVVAQYRGGLGKVAEILGRNRRNLMELLERLDLMEHVVAVRASERKRILAAPLKDRLSDLLFREKLLEDLGCLKEVDDVTRQDVQARIGHLAKGAESIEDALQLLGTECGLEDSGLKRLVWRYDLRRQLRDLKLKSTTVARSRT